MGVLDLFIDEVGVVGIEILKAFEVVVEEAIPLAVFVCDLFVV